MSTPPAPESHQNTQIDLSSASEEDLVSRLEAALAKQTFDSIYFLGGSLPLPDSASSLVVRWESPENHDLNHCIHWPPVSSKDQEALSTLLHDCTAVTFGRNGQDVLDKSYRKAGAFDPKRFCVNFCPYSSGIVSAITSILHPSSNVLVDRKVRAELYKLNIYSGPSGRFKTHVDTPRGATQFGSLVVCLPYHHSGGQLTVKHPADSNTETVFDWSGRVDAIHWAAFFSDCPHEVLEITAGHRVTLTYNLYDENEQARSEPQLLSSFEPDMDSAMPRLMKALMEHGQNNTTRTVNSPSFKGFDSDLIRPQRSPWAINALIITHIRVSRHCSTASHAQSCRHGGIRDHDSAWAQGSIDSVLSRSS